MIIFDIIKQTPNIGLSSTIGATKKTIFFLPLVEFELFSYRFLNCFPSTLCHTHSFTSTIHHLHHQTKRSHFRWKLIQVDYGSDCVSDKYGSWQYGSGKYFKKIFVFVILFSVPTPKQGFVMASLSYCSHFRRALRVGSQKVRSCDYC